MTETEITPEHLQATGLLNFHHPALQRLLEARGWAALPPFARIGAAYDFVRDEIAFGYNLRDDLPASAVLADGYGQCNTKAVLLMALLRALGIACRLHGFTIHKALQRGVVPEPVYALAPAHILHSWVEVWLDGGWITLEGFILDRAFLSVLQAGFKGQGEQLCGFGAGTDRLSDPPVAWCGRDTYIQKTGISADLGVFATPDAFYGAHRQDLTGLRGLLYRYGVRHWMNARVRRIRRGDLPPVPAAMRRHRHG